MLPVSLDALAGVPVVAFVAWLGRPLPVPAPLAWAGTGLLVGPALLDLAGPAGGRLLVEGAALLTFFEIGLRLTDQQGRLVRSSSRQMLSVSLPCAAAVFAAAVAGAFALGATLPQSIFAGLVLLPVSILLPPDAPPVRSAVLLGTGTASLCGLIALPLLANETFLPGWILALRYVFICIAFVSVALVLRHRLVPRRLHAAHRKKGKLMGVAAGVLALGGASAWIGPGLGFSCFVAGLVLSRSRWEGHPLFARLSGIRTGSALLFFAGLGLLAASLRGLDLVSVAVGVAGGLLFLRAATLAFIRSFRQRAAVRQALCLGPLRAPLGAVAFAVLYAGLDAQVLPVTWTAAAPPVLAIAALMLAAGRAVEGGLWTASGRAHPAKEPPNAGTIGPGAPREAARRMLCTAPFFVRRRPAERAPRLHLVRVAPDAPATCLSLRRLALRRHYGVEVVGLWHHDAYVHAPPYGYTLQAGDHVLLSAPPAQLSRSASVFRTSLH